MTTIRRFCCEDLLRFAPVNLDHLTETVKPSLSLSLFHCSSLIFSSLHSVVQFNMSFYMTYLARWPDYVHVAEAPGNRIMGYIMGKVEGQGESWHGHVTAVTVASEYRRQQLAKKLMHLLEDISDKINRPIEEMLKHIHFLFLAALEWFLSLLSLWSSDPHLYAHKSMFVDKAYFVDLFVRASNMPAIKMYEKLGYVIYRRVLRYYSGEEDGLDMRKALSHDVEKKSIIPLKRPVTPDELEYD